MVSTLLGYKLYANNFTQSLERIQSTASVKKDQQYYADHIGKVSSVDDLLNDYRLYTYAMKAYGLEDQVASKGLMRKVLESDLSDSASFANKLSDDRYRAFAAAFNFKTNAASETAVVQSASQKGAVEEAYSEARVRQGTAAAAKAEYFLGKIGSVANVDDLLSDSSLYSVVLGSLGADPATVSRDFVRQALTDTLPSDISVSNPAWLTIADKFNFAADGQLKTDANGVRLPAQTAAQANGFVYDFNVATGNDVNSYAAAFNTDYYNGKIGSITSASDLVADPRLLNYVLTSVGFDPSYETATFVRQILTSDPASATSTLNALPETNSVEKLRKERYQTLRGMFNFDTNGTVAAGNAQTDAQRSKLNEAYFANYQTNAIAKEETQTSTFETLMAKVNSVTDLLAKSDAFGRDVLNYALKAFDIDPSTASLYKIRRVLTSDVSNPNSYVNKLKDERFEKLAAAFNFDADGKATTQRLVQSVAGQTTVGTKYKATFGTMSEAQKAVVTADTKDYIAAIGQMRSLDDLLADTKTLNYALKAYGLDKEKLSTDDIRKMLTSDLGSKTSFANANGDKRYVEFAKAFNFTPQGTVARDTANGVQSGANRLSTDNLFLLQTMETQAGDLQGEGVRLGLYFLRKAPELSSSLGILADKALLEVVKTALGLPDNFSQLDVEKQQKVLDAKLKVADFKDSKKLDAFIQRFSALYDLANPANATGQGTILDLFGGSTSGAGLYGML